MLSLSDASGYCHRVALSKRENAFICFKTTTTIMITTTTLSGLHRILQINTFFFDLHGRFNS